MAQSYNLRRQIDLDVIKQGAQMKLRYAMFCMLVILASCLTMPGSQAFAAGGPLIGDVNLDGAVNFEDIVPFCKVLTGGGFQNEADINQDGAVDLLDCDLFASLLVLQQTASFTVGNPASPADFYWSLNDLNSGAVNAPLSLNVPVGGTQTVYLYYTTNGPGNQDINIGAALNVATSAPGIVKFTAGESLNYDVTVGGAPIGSRWEICSGGGAAAAGPALLVSTDLIIGLTAFNVCGNNGMVDANTGGGVFLDEGYDAAADAFLFGTVEVCGVTPGTVSVVAGPNDLGILNVPGPFNLSINGATVTAVLLGDVNLDTVVNLLDVGPFIMLLGSGIYQVEADCNFDGNLDLLDVGPFIKIVAGG